MQFQVCESDDSCQPGAQYTNPRVVVEEHHGAPLLNCSGLVLVRQLIERLGVARAIDAGVRVLRRPDSRANGEMGPWSCSNDHLREAGRTSATPIATAHRSTIARTPKLPTFLPYSTVPVAQSAGRRIA